MAAMLDLALIEPVVGADAASNFAHGARGVEIALDLGASLIALPELWVTGFAQSRINNFLRRNSPHGVDAVVELEARCHHRGCDLVYGYPEASEGDLYFNALRLPSSHPQAAYRKLMVYVDVEKNFRSARDLATNALAFLHENRRGDVFLIAVQLCADLRFPEIARAGADLGAVLILNCSQWRARPRIPDAGPAHPDHWEWLLRARAIENQVYVAGCGAKGTAYSYELLGRSGVYDPLGRRLEPSDEVAIDPAGDCGRVLLFHLDISLVGDNADPQARHFIPWIEEMAPVIDRLKARTRTLLGSAARSPLAGKARYDVFLSHAAIDNQHAQSIAEKLEKKLTVFFAPKSLRYGDNFSEEIRAALLASEEVWILMTPSAAGSEWVTTEWGAAWALNKVLVPILLRVAPAQLPERLRAIQSVDYHQLPDLIEQSLARKKIR